MMKRSQGSSGWIFLRLATIVLLSGWLAVNSWSQDGTETNQDDPSTEQVDPNGEDPDAPNEDEPVAGKDATDDQATSEPVSVLDEDEDPAAAGAIASPKRDRLAAVTIFVLAVFVGFEVITKVPPTLHTPLMSGSNAVSGITVVGAIIVAGHQYWASSWLGMLAIALATVNVVGGFLVTHRMLAMFQRR